jgi:hypothetical protein
MKKSWQFKFTQSLQLLRSSARPFPAGSSCSPSTCGSGIVDAAAALNAVLNPPPTSTAGPSPTPSRTNTPGSKATRMPTPTQTITPTETRTSTSTFTVTPTSSATATATFTEVGPTHTPTWTGTSPLTGTLTHTPNSSETPGTNDLIFADGFEGGNLAAWSSSIIDSGDLSVNSSAALVGGQGLEALIDDNNALVVIDERPALETRYRVRFYFDPNSIPMAVGDAHVIFMGSSSGGTVQHFQMELRFQSTGYEVRALLVNDAKVWISTNGIPLSDAPHTLEVD